MSDILPGIGFYTAIMEPIPTSLYTPILILSALLYGPLKMGVTYVYRNFAREEHAWLSDIPARGWANVKQGLFFGLLDIVVVLFLLNNIIGNFAADSDVVAILLLIARYVSIVVLVVYLFMRRYFYVMAVTVELSVIQIMKNAWLFAIIGLGRNILASLVSAAVWLATLFIIPLVTVVALPLVTFSLCGFSSVFICYPVIKKYIILPAMQAGKTDAAPGEGETPSISPEEAESQPDEADTSQENIEEK